MKVLIVDDSALVRRLIGDILTPWADEIRECTDGEDALEAYNQQMPDLVLMDIRIGRVDGIEATRRIRAAHPAARVLIVTDYDDDALRVAALQAGACGYALKDYLCDLPNYVETLG